NISVDVVRGIAITTTRKIAEIFDKRHDNILKDIQTLIDTFYVDRGLLKSKETPSGEISNTENKNLVLFNGNLVHKEDQARVEDLTDWFIKTSYVDEQNGQEYPEYIMTKDGFTLLVMGYTGAKAIRFKMDYIKAFNKIEQQLLIN